MQMHEMPTGGQPPIDGYGPGGFRLGGTWYPGNLALGPSGAAPMEGDLATALQALLDRDPGLDTLILGQGADIAPMPATLSTPLEAAGIGYEHMATGAACRTYNVLLGEERRVGALLLAL
ncbi:MAG: Mth938-like domain-containing protein [Pseudomonadota bacterium]